MLECLVCCLGYVCLTGSPAPKTVRFGCARCLMHQFEAHGPGNCSSSLELRSGLGGFQFYPYRYFSVYGRGDHRVGFGGHPGSSREGLSAGGERSSLTLCAGNSFSSGDSCTVDVTFSPLALGLRIGAVQLLDGGGNAVSTAYVSGWGQGALLVSGKATVSTIAGIDNTPGYNFDPASNASATSNRLDNPTGIITDPQRKSLYRRSVEPHHSQSDSRQNDQHCSGRAGTESLNMPGIIERAGDHDCRV